jgi:exopolysaccharide biosynthesis protein
MPWTDMKKKACVFLFLLFSFKLVIAQADSLYFVSKQATSNKIAKGAYWHQLAFSNKELFGANQQINFISIAPKVKRLRLSIVRSDSLERTSQIARNKNALAGINGSFFKMRGPDPDYLKDLQVVPKLERSKLDRNRSIVYFRENDSLISKNIPDKDSIRKRHQQGVIVINNRKVGISRNNPADLHSEHQLPGQDIISTGPVMILSNVDQQIPNDAFCNDRHPRTSLGIKADGTVLLFVVDGRLEQSAGMSIPELQKVMRWLGCVDAINLDGGGSTTMYISNQPFNGVVNHPSDNKRFDHEGEREVANAILLIKK